MTVISVKNIKLEVKQIANILIFEEVSKAELQVFLPPLDTSEDGYEIENTFHPIYQDSITVYELLRSNLAFDAILTYAVNFEPKYLKDSNWKKMFEILQSQTFIELHDNEALNFLKFYVLADQTQAKQHLTQLAILHEAKVFDIFKSIQVARSGRSIHEYPIKNSINTGIEPESMVIEGVQLINPLDEYSACVASGMDWSKWISCEYTNQTKAYTVALYRLNKVVDSHQQDAVQIETEAKNKKGK